MELNKRKSIWKAAYIVTLIWYIFSAIFFLIYIIGVFTFIKTNVNSTNEIPNQNNISTGLIVFFVITFLIETIIQIYFIWSINKFSKKIGTQEEEYHLVFAILLLIFCNFISGILIIVDQASCSDKFNKVVDDNNYSNDN